MRKRAEGVWKMSLSYGLTVVIVTLVLVCSCDRARLEYKDATKTDTVAAYERFLALYPQHELANSAKVRMADAAFRDLTGVTEPQAYMDYIVRYPDSSHISEVTAHLEPILYSKCMVGGQIMACDDYLRVCDEYSCQSDVKHKSQELAFTLDLERATEKDTFDAYQEVVNAHPEQDQLVMFEGAIGSAMNMRIYVYNLCPEDKPALEKLAAQQGVPFDSVVIFSGFWVGPPPKAGQPDNSDKPWEFEKGKRNDCYPIPAWSAKKMGLFTTGASSDGGSTVTYFGGSANKVFTFVGKKVGSKYHIVAAKQKENMKNQQ
jgi:hypothetical protein